MGETPFFFQRKARQGPFSQLVIGYYSSCQQSWVSGKQATRTYVPGVVQRPCDESLMLLIIRDQRTLQEVTVAACTAGVHPREPYVSPL